jgi:hypothetical protein
MYLEINGERLISEIQHEFSAVYPFLKIEFFRNGHTRRNRSLYHKLIPHNKFLKDIWSWKKDTGRLEISDAMSVTEFEDALKDHFGLSAQVFRRSGNLWLETTMTDNWTLKQQNDHGREISIPISNGHKKSSLNEELDRDPNP